MDGSATGTAAGHNRLNGRFIAGNIEYRARQQRLAERVRQLNLDYDPSPSQLALLPIIARHLDDALRGRSAERRGRAGIRRCFVNFAHRGLPRGSLPGRHCRLIEPAAVIEPLRRRRIFYPSHSLDLNLRNFAPQATSWVEEFHT